MFFISLRLTSRSIPVDDFEAAFGYSPANFFWSKGDVVLSFDGEWLGGFREHSYAIFDLFDRAESELADALRSCARYLQSARNRGLIDAGEPSIDASVESTDNWLADLGAGLLSAVSAFFNAMDFSTAMAHWIATDILLGRFLSACYRLRLNGLVPR